MKQGVSAIKTAVLISLTICIYFQLMATKCYSAEMPKKIFKAADTGIQLSRPTAHSASVQTNSPAQIKSTGLPSNGVFRFGRHEGYLLMPPNYRADRKYPLIIHFHGRGGNHIKSNLMTDSFSLFRQKALARGYIMVTPGYGSDCWMNASAEDITLKCLEYVKERLSIDDSRVYILGCSMGGGAALTFAGRHPDNVEAVCDMFGVSDFERFYRAGHYHRSISTAFGGTPDEILKVYRERSGISYIEQLKSIPLLVIHGDKDGTVPLWNSQNLVDKLQAAGAHPMLIVVPGKGHSNALIKGLEDTVLDHFDATVKKSCKQVPKEKKTN